MTTNMVSHSRGPMRPRFSKSFRSSKKERAQGTPGARCTRDLVCNVHRRVRTRAYRAAESIRHSLRNGFTAYNALSPVIGFLATVAPEKLASQELDASAEASGPHVFAVRLSAFVTGTSASTAPCPAFRDDRERPSWWSRMGGIMPLICPPAKAKYF